MSEEQQQLHVLAVDDSIIDRKVIERLLKISSCKVTTVDSGKRALQYLGLLDGGGNSDSDNNNGLKVNLIITDYWMPGMTGFELLKKIKESSSNCREIPVVIMSSENVLPWINRCLEEGAEEFLVKPVQLSDVRRLKNNHIKRDEVDEQFQGKKSASTVAAVSTTPAVATTTTSGTTSGTTSTTATTNKRKLEEDSSRGVYISPSSLDLRESPARRLRPLDEVEAI